MLHGFLQLRMLYAFVIVYSYFYGGKVPLIPGATAQFFGTGAIGQINAVIHAFSMFFAAFGPFIGGWIHDRTGSYTLVFLMCAVMWALAAMVSLTLRQPVKGAAVQPQGME